MEGTVFNIQRFSLFDGPGVRTVVFLKGCPLSCLWCHNPEGLSSLPQVFFAPEKCIACGECMAVCPRARHGLREGLHAFLRDGCTGCGLCADACPTEALALSGKVMTVDEVMDEVLRDLPVYRESGGGLTLSGGEPLCQADFALALLKAAKEKGLSTCIETSGAVSAAALRSCIPYTDVFYYDYKATGAEMHRHLCGTDGKLILDNLSVLDEANAVVTLRCPIVPGANDSPEHIEGIARIAGSHPSVKEVHLEPYHELGISKSERLGVLPRWSGAAPAHTTLKQYCADIQQRCGKPCIIS